MATLNSMEANWIEPEDDDTDRLIEAGWWTDTQVNEVVDAIKALNAATVYENGNMAEGVSVDFLARITLLNVAAGLDVPERLEAEARARFAS